MNQGSPYNVYGNATRLQESEDIALTDHRPPDSTIKALRKEDSASCNVMSTPRLGTELRGASLLLDTNATGRPS